MRRLVQADGLVGSEAGRCKSQYRPRATSDVRPLVADQECRSQSHSRAGLLIRWRTDGPRLASATNTRRQTAAPANEDHLPEAVTRAGLIAVARKLTPLRPLVAQGRASRSDTVTMSPTFTSGFSPAE